MTPLIAPARPLVRRGVCGAGPGPCGAPNARLFTCGWRCTDHEPKNPTLGRVPAATEMEAA